MKKAFIYLVLDEAEYPRYVGKSVNPPQRCGLHLRRNHERGWATFRILEEVSKNDTWQDRERFWIRFYKIRFPDIENKTKGGGYSFLSGREPPQNRRGFKKSPEALVKLKAAAARRKGVKRPEQSLKLRGQKRTAETRARMSAAHMGHKMTSASIHRMKKTLSEKGDGHWKKIGELTRKRMLGSKLSDRTKAKIGLAHKGRKLSFTPEQIAKRPQNCKGYKPSAALIERRRQSHIGLKLSEAARKNISDGLKKRWAELRKAENHV